tara:strand:+ start:247 stop:417 length:171 start_codon:yes stop_codon:yes gene_type:complete
MLNRLVIQVALVVVVVDLVVLAEAQHLQHKDTLEVQLPLLLQQDGLAAAAEAEPGL